MLPNIPYPTAVKSDAQTVFGGLDRRAGAGNGSICGMTNLWSGDAPLLGTRPGRMTLGSVTAPHGVFANGIDLYHVAGTKLYRNDVEIGTVADSDKVWAALGERVIIWPDKLVYTPPADGAAGTLASIEDSVSTDATFEDGTYAGEAAQANTIKRAAYSTVDFTEYFRPGDALTVTNPNGGINDGLTLIVREVDTDELRFYENSFETSSTVFYLTVSRTAPDLDYLCTCNNRVWGCKGDTVQCCALGDPLNWNKFDGVETDAWSVETGTAGQFTGCVTYIGYPTFFKEEHIFRVYGNRPKNFESVQSADLGVKTGCHKSLAVAGEVLYYLSRAGFVRYTGGAPVLIDAPLNEKYRSAAAGSDGKRYWASATTERDVAADRTTELLCFDPSLQAWWREDALAAHSFAYRQGLYCLTTDGRRLIWSWHNLPAGASAEAAFDSVAEFRYWDYVQLSQTSRNLFQGKYPLRLWVRAEVETSLTVWIRYDGGSWEQAGSVAGGDGVFVIPVVVRRCERYALKFTGTGAWRVYAIERECASRNEYRMPAWRATPTPTTPETESTETGTPGAETPGEENTENGGT